MKKYILLLMATLSVLCSPLQANEKNVNIYQSSREAPDTFFYDTYGYKLTLADFKGKFVLLLFWSRDCVPCIRELRSIKGFYDNTHGSDIAILPISDAKEWKNAEELNNFLKKYKAEGLPTYIDRRGKLGESFGIYAYPHTVLINAKGNEIGRIRGAAEWDSHEVIEYIMRLKSKYNNF